MVNLWEEYGVPWEKILQRYNARKLVCRRLLVQCLCRKVFRIFRISCIPSDNSLEVLP